MTEQASLPWNDWVRNVSIIIKIVGVAKSRAAPRAVLSSSSPASLSLAELPPIATPSEEVFFDLSRLNVMLRECYAMLFPKPARRRFLFDSMVVGSGGARTSATTTCNDNDAPALDADRARGPPSITFPRAIPIIPRRSQFVQSTFTAP